MAAFPRSPVLIRHLPTGGGVVAGAVAAVSIALLSTDALEHLVWTGGIAALVPAAQPPLGTTARVLLTIAAAVVAGAVGWSALFLLFGPGGFLAARPDISAHPAVRRADAHPDAPPRKPMTAADLGTPLMEVGLMEVGLMEVGKPAPVVAQPAAAAPVERPLPSRLDQPLAAFDPAAVPLVPREPQRALPALAPGERLDTFTLTPPPPTPLPSTQTASARLPAKRESTAQTIDTLLRRLEEGAGRRTARL